MKGASIRSVDEGAAPGPLSGARLASLLGVGRIDYESDFLELPKDVPREQCPVLAEISLVDRRSSHMFGPGTSARIEVKELLRNSLVSDIPCKSRRFLDRAKQSFRDRLLSRHRVRYIFGVLIGILGTGTLALRAHELSSGSLERLAMPSALCCTWTILFAGMGTLCSVFTRLSKIDLCEETSGPLVFLSGFFRPVTAALFTLAIVQLLKLDIVSFHVGAVTPGTAQPAQEHLFLLAAFFSGFSERFASELMGRAGRVIGAPPESASERQANSEQPQTPSAASAE